MVVMLLFLIHINSYIKKILSKFIEIFPIPILKV